MLLSDAESVLISRCKGLLVMLAARVVTPVNFLVDVGLDFSTQDGTNRDLRDPIGRAIRACGGTTASPAEPTDLELLSLNASATDMFLDAAELRLLKTILNNAIARVDTETGNNKYYWSQSAKALQAMIDRMAAEFNDAHLNGRGEVSVGQILSNYVAPGSYPYAWPVPGTQPYEGGPTWP